MPVSSSKASAVVNKTKSLEELYDMLNTDFDLGSLDEFKTKLESPDKRKILYEAANTNNVLGKSFDEFELNFGFKKKDQSETKLEPDVQPKAPADLSLPASSAQPQGPSQLESASRLSSEDKQPYNFGATPDEVKNNAKLYHDQFISKAKKKIDDAEAQFNQQVEWLNGEVSTGKIGRAEANGLIRGFKSQYLRLSSRAQEEYESELQDLQDQANNVITSFGAPATNVVKKPEPIVDGPKESSTVARAALAFAYRNDPDVRSAVDRAMDVIRVESPSGAYFSTSLPDIYSVFDYNKANDIITKFKQAEKEPLVGDQVGRIKYSTNPLNYNTLAGAALAYFSFEDNDVYQALQKASKDSKKVFEGGSEVDTRTLPGNIRDVFGSKKTDEYIARFLALPNIQTYIRTNPYLYNEIQAKNRRDVLDQLQLQTVEDYFAKSGITPQGLRYQKIDMNTPVAKDLFMNPQKYGITIDQEDPIGSLENVYDEAFGQEILQLNTPKVDATANNAIRYSPQKMSADIQRQREIDLDTKRRTFIADQYKMLLEDKQSANKFLSSFLKNPDLNTGRMTSVQLEGLRDDVSKNRTALFALETLIKSKKVEEDLVGAKSIEEAAVLFSAMTDRDLAKVVSDNTTLVNARLFPAKTPFYEKAAPQVKSIGDINQYLGPATIGMSMYSLLSDPVAMQQLKQSNPSIYNELVNRKDELFDRYPAFGIKVVGDMIAQKMEDMGMNNAILNLVTKEETDKAVDALVLEGKMDQRMVDFYKNNVRTTAFKEFFKNIIGYQRYSTTGFLESMVRGAGTGTLELGRGIIEFTGAANLRSDKRWREIDLAKRDFIAGEVVPNGLLAEMTSSGGHLIGYLAPTIIGSRGAGLPGLISKSNIGAGVFFAQSYANAAARSRFMSDNPLFQRGYNSISALIDAYMVKLLPGHSEAGNVSKMMSKEIGEVVTAFSSKNISAVAARDRIQNSFVKAVLDMPQLSTIFAGQTAKNTLIMGAMDLAHQIEDGVFTGRPLSEWVDADRLFESTRHALISSPVLSIMGTIPEYQKAKGAISRLVYQMATDPIGTKKSILEMAAGDPAKLLEATDQISNLTHAVKILSDVSATDLSTGQKMKYTLNALEINQKRKEIDAATDPVIKQRLQDQIKEIEKVQNDILDGRDLGVYEGDEAAEVMTAAVVRARNMVGRLKKRVAPPEPAVVIDNTAKPVAGSRLFNDPNPLASEVEAEYKKQTGIDAGEPARITSVDAERAKKIADAFDQMQNNPNDPEVREAYEAMAKETMDQFGAITKAGIKFEIWEGDGEPYKNSEEMIRDVRDNKHMYILSTAKEFGEAPITDKQRQENPLLRDSGATDVNGKPLLVNDVFRGVHDFFGHTKLGNSFGAIGEENAWNVHARMYSPKARRAMTTETRGQNSWVNFGKHMRNPDGTIIKKGDPGYLGPRERPFAEQKIGLLPEEFSNIDDNYTFKGEAEAPKFRTEREAIASFTPEERQKFLDHIANEEFDQADAMVSERVMDTEPVMFSKENVDGFDMTGWSQSAVEAITDVKNIIKAAGGVVASGGKEMKVFIHDSDKSYNNALKAIGASGVSKGFYMSSTGEIHINGSRATRDTIFHEGFHPVLDFVAKNNPEMVMEMFKQLKSIPGAEALVAKAERIYKNQGNVQVMKEAITDFFANVAKGSIKITSSNFEKVKNWIKSVMNKLGFNFPIQKLIDASNAKDLKSFIENMAAKFRRGEEITLEELEQYKKKSEATESSEGVDINTGIETFKDSDRGIQWGKIEDETVGAVKTAILSPKDLAGIKISRVLFYDNTRVGSLTIKNSKNGYTPKVDGKGGFFYSYMPEAIKNKAVLAFTSVNQAIQTLQRQMMYPDAVQAIAAQNVSTAHLGNKSTLKALFGESGSKELGIFQQAALAENGKTLDPSKEAEILGVLMESARELAGKRNQSTGELTPNAELISKVLEKAGDVTTLEEFRDKVLIGEGDSFGTRNTLFQYIFQEKPTKVTKNTRESHNILHYKYGIPTIAEIAEGNNQKQLNNAETGDVVKLVKPYTEPVIYTTVKDIYEKYSKNPTPEMVKAGIKIELLPESIHHESYPFVLRGENVGVFDNYISATHLYKEHSGIPKKQGFYTIGRMKKDAPAGEIPVDIELQGAPEFSRDETTAFSDYGEVKSKDSEAFNPSDKPQFAKVVFDETGFVSTKYWVDRLKESDLGYLDGVIEHILRSREQLKSGSVPIEKTIKSYLITMASMGSSGGYYDNWTSKRGVELNPVFIENVRGKKWVRPEGLAAAYLVTPEGMKLVSDIKSGAATVEQVRDLFLFVGTGRDQAKAEATISNMGTGKFDEFTSLLNENKGSDFNDILEKSKMLKGIGDGKSGFLSQYFGVSTRAVIDARELNAWIAGDMALTPEQKEMKAKAEGSKKLQSDFVNRIEQVGRELGYPEDLAGYMAHHAIWDNISGTKTTHEGEYRVTSGVQFSREERPEVGQINWERSPEGKGDPSISSRNPIVTQSAKDLKAGKITNEEHRATVSENSPIGPITRFFEPATEQEIRNGLSKDKIEKVNAPMQDDTVVGLRLDIPAYSNNNTWVVSVHEGSTNAGKAVSYRNVARITDVRFGVEPRAALSIASGVPKTTIGRMFGKWQNIEGATMEEQGENAKKLIQQIVDDPNWVQVGMNPFRHSYFYDRNTEVGRPIVSAEEVIQVGGLVYAKKPVYGEWTDEAYRVKDLFDAAGAPVQFSAGKSNSIERLTRLLEEGLITPTEFSQQMDKISPAKPVLTSTKNKVVTEERAARGLPAVEKSASRAYADVWEKAKSDVDGGVIRIREWAKRIIEKPRPLTDAENAALLYDRVRLSKERNRVMQAIEEAAKDGNTDREVSLRFDLAEVEDAMRDNDMASTLGGSELGRGLAARRMMAREDYSLAAMERRMKVANGGKDLTPEQTKLIRELEQKLAEVTAKLEKYEENKGADAIEKTHKSVKAAAKPMAVDPARRKAILDRIREKLGKTQMSAEEPSPISENVLSDIKELFKMYVEGNMQATPDEVVRMVHSDISEVIDGVDLRDVRDAISDYGKVREMSKDELSARVRDLKAQMRLISGLEDVESGVRPKKSGMQRDKPSDEERRLRQELNDKMKNADFKDEQSESEYRSALDGVKKRLENQIKDLEDMIATGRRRQPKEGIEYDAEAVALEMERDRLREVLDQIDEASGLTEQRKVKAVENMLDRTIKNLEERIAGGELETSKPEKVTGGDIEAKRARVKELRDELNILRDAAGITERKKVERYKVQIEKRIAEFERRINEGDFSKKTITKTVLDEEGISLNKNLQDIKYEYEKARIKAERANRTKTQKFIDSFLHFRREILLSGITTLGKIGTAAGYLIATKPIEEMAGQGLKYVFPKMAAGAPREGGGINPAAEAKAITELFRKASLVDVKRIMGGKKSELEAAYGKKVPTPEEQSFFGNLHAIIKYLPKKSEIFRSMEKRFKHAIENGEDVNSDVVRMRIVSEAIIDGNRAIFMGDNAVVDAYKAAIRSLERPGKGSKSLVNIMKFLFPIIKVPTNYVAATGQYLIGGLKAMAILSRGYDNLTPAEKDTFMRLMKRQSVGLAFFAIGFLNPGAVGGYYTGKREEDDLHAGEISVFGLHLPHWMTHAPIIEVMQFGSTVRRLHDSYEEQAELSGEPNKRGYLTSALMAGTKLIEQVPFLGVTGDFTEATKSDNKMNTFIGTILRSLAVPPDIQKMAKGQGPLGFVAKEAGLYRGDVDKYGETVKRKAVTLLEQIMLGVPGMRESLPEQDPVGSARDQIRREIKESPEWENARQLAKDNLASAGEEIKKSGLLEKIDMGLLKKAGIWEDKQLERLIIKALINPDVSKFWDMPAEKQIRRWINLTDKEKKEYLPYIHSKETFMNLEKRDADILKEPNAVKAVKEIASMSGW